MDKGSASRVTRASSKSPARRKAPSQPKSKSPARQKASKSPARKSPARKSPARTKSPARKSPARKSPGRPKKTPPPAPPLKEQTERSFSPVRKASPVRKLTSSENSLKERERQSSPYVKLERQGNIDVKTLVSDASEGIEHEVEVLFLDDNIKYKTSLLNVEVKGKLNVGDIKKVQWEDGNYYDARILNFIEIARDRSVSLPKATSSSVVTTQVYSSESSLIRRSSRLKRDEELGKMNAEVGKILKANNVPLPPQYERKYGEKPVREFGSWPGALVSTLLLPTATLVLQMSCTKSKCTGVVPPSMNWKTYLDLHIAGIYLGFVAWQAVLSSLPLGRKSSYGQVQARLSGFYICLLTLAVLSGFYYYGFLVTSVLSRSVALLSSAILAALLIAFALFFKGGRSQSSTAHNVNADGNKIYDFFIGRELQSSVGPLNIKAMLTRMEFITILLLDILYLLKYVETHAASVHSPTLLFVVAAHTVYVVDTLWFEEKFMTSFAAQYEGVGYMTAMAAATWPFLVTLVTRFVLYTNYEAPTYRLVLCGIFFALGYFIYRASNSQKAEYRKNPQHPVFSKYETIATFHGKRLMCSGWWGLVRHPNYVGDIVMMWSIAAVCGLAHWLPYVFPALHLAVLVHRTARVSTRCQTLYGAAWDRYAQLVKYRLVPRVF